MITFKFTDEILLCNDYDLRKEPSTEKIMLKNGHEIHWLFLHTFCI